MTLYVEPAAGPAPIIRFIGTAQRPVNVEIYYLSSQAVLDAIAADHARCLRARVIVDGRPCRMAHRLVLSSSAEAKLAAIADQPGPVSIEAEEPGDDPPLLHAIAAKGALARVLVPATQTSTARADVRSLRRDGVQVRLLPVRPLYLHAKMIVGGSYGFIGSENVPRASLDANREVGVVMTAPDNHAALRRTFRRDWRRANVAS